MQYIAIKFGTKFVSDMKNPRKMELTKDVNKAVLWPMDMEPYIEEAVENLEHQGLTSRLVRVGDKNA